MERINIAGAGLAGLSAAIHLAQLGVRTNLISVLPSERAQSVLAEGGINAALNTMGEDDKVEYHFEDTMKGGVNLADPNAVAGLTGGAPEIVLWLKDLGAPFQMEGDRMIQRNFGGQKKKRTAYAKSSTGKILMTTLIDEARKYEAKGLITRYKNHEILRVHISDKCEGLHIRNTYTDEYIFCPGKVLLAIGGMNGIFPGKTTGTVKNTGNLTAGLFTQGLEMANLEFIQYHPTTVSIPGKRLLISEAARGEGGRLFTYRNGEKWYFMEEFYPELGNLMPRDVVSREIYNVTSMEDCSGHVYLDLTHLPAGTWENKLSDMREEIIEYLSVDPVKDPVEVSGGIHFFMGGIKVDEAHRTNIPGLYAAGECACQYHGANRLGGNSLLGAIYGGKVAAGTIFKEIEYEMEKKPESLGKVPEGVAKDADVSNLNKEELSELLFTALGIKRTEEQLREGLAGIETHLAKEGLTVTERNRAILGKAMILAALERHESRGAHYRIDFPERDDVNFHKTTVVKFSDGDIHISYEEIPERRAEV
ncbi:MAG: FAD-binding protein [Firmicutes bacterium]|nr:FAD-binding protein [Bacillota bacterium]MBQ9707619.1 FAD-binding protein [Bacillota bacterium]